MPTLLLQFHESKVLMGKNKPSVIAQEFYGTSFKRIYYSDDTSSCHENSWTKSIKSIFFLIFLPHGYPESVSKDYLQYQIWDSIQAFASSITGGIAIHAVLKGAGVGDENASTLAATMTWIMRDGVSMIGRITFSWLKGTKLDSDCKQWRLFADILNDISIFVDLISPHFMNYFFHITCISGLLKSIVGVAGSATRAALTQHQARKNNMADVSAKDGSQETLVNLIALVCNLVFIPVVVQNYVLIWVVYALMTIVHITANYYAVKSVIMETFNEARFQIYINHYIKSKGQEFLSVENVNKAENVWIYPTVGKSKIYLGSSFTRISQSLSLEKVKEILAANRKRDYMFVILNGKIYICLRTSSSLVLIKAMFHAYWFINGYEKCKNTIDEEFELFLKKTEQTGWKTDAVMFNVDLWRVKW